MNWNDIPGWFQWRSAQEEAVHRFPEGSRFVEVGNFLGRSLCSLGEVANLSGKRFTLIGVDTCQGSGLEGPGCKDYHGEAVAEGGGTFAGILHKNIIACGHAESISMIVADSVTASTFFADGSLDWVHLDARHDRAHVMADISAWLPKVKADGWLSGDDYDEIKWPEVVRAVRTLLPEARPWSNGQWRWTRASATENAGAAIASWPQQATVICTLGVHRSGTSLVMRMLNLLGVHLGPDARVLTAGDDNPKGYWEHRPFVDINDALLERFGGQWDEPPVFPPEWFRDPRVADLRERARQLLSEDFAAQTLWGWKDPRACLTLPFWQDLVGPMRYVICVRNPAAVVESLAVRRGNGISRDKAERLWLVHVQALLSQTSGQPRMFVFYEDILEDWGQTLGHLAAFIGHPERAADPSVHEAVSEFLENDLCHHRMTMEDLAGDPRISFPTKSLYLALRGHAVLSHDALDMFAAEALESMARIESDLQGMTLERDEQARQTEDALKALQEIHGSAAWKLVATSRNMIAGVLPDGSRRRRVFRAVLRRIAHPAHVDPGTV